MANLAHAISLFRSGALSRSDFFAQVDSVLAMDQANAVRLLETLVEEHAKTPLPPDVYAEVQRRIAGVVESRQGLGPDETCVQTKPGDRATPQPTSSARGSTGIPNDERSDAAPERIKGVGDTLNGRFVLEECIGFGGMGTVYKALDLRKLEASDRKPYIAIKVLNAQFRGHPKSLIALQREARKAQTLAHPNIVSVYDFDRDGSMVYLTMEYLSGKPLSRTLRMPDFKGMPYVEAMRIVNGMGKALAYAHERGFVHCDFKPANVFLTDSGNVKVIDFGIARVFQKPEEEADATVFDAGSLGALTPAYASPEMLEHREPDPRDDIYALACITYELLTGRHPFDRLSATQARDAGMKPQQPKNLGRSQWRALKTALSLDRESRTPTVARFLKEISGERPAAVPVTLVASGLMIIVLVAAGLTYYYYWQSRAGVDGERSATVPAPAQNVPSTAPVPATAPPMVQTPSTETRTPSLSVAAVMPILAGVPCSALHPAARDHALQVEGYLPKSFGTTRLKDMLSSVPGATSVDLNVQEVTDDECSVIKLFARYWIMNRQAGGAASMHTRKRNTELTEGDPLIVDITTPGYDSYVNIDYYVLDGSVVHLLPSPRARDNQAPAKYTATIGSLGNWVISKPFGNELLVLLITPVPLFDSLRAESEPKADYLRAVEQRLEQIAGKYGAEKIAVDFVQITTKARKP